MIHFKIKLTQNNFKLDLSEELPNVQIFGIYGHSGAGKSSILNALAGFIQSEECELKSDAFELNQFKMSYVDQDVTLFPHMSVERHLEYIEETNKQSIDHYLKLFNIEDLRHKKPSELSGGQQQRVSLCLALLHQPNLLLLDEPFSHMDRDLRRTYRDLLLHEIQQHDILAFIVSHDLSDLYTLCDHILHIEEGKIIQRINKSEALRSSNSLNHNIVLSGEIIFIDESTIHVLIGEHINHFERSELPSDIKVGESVKFKMNRNDNSIIIL